MQSVTINTNVVSSNPAHGEVYSIQLHVIKFESYLRRVCVVFSTNTTDSHDIAEILLKVALNTITLPLIQYMHDIYLIYNSSISITIKKITTMSTIGFKGWS